MQHLTNEYIIRKKLVLVRGKIAMLLSSEMIMRENALVAIK